MEDGGSYSVLQFLLKFVGLLRSSFSSQRFFFVCFVLERCRFIRSHDASVSWLLSVSVRLLLKQ